MAACRIWLNNPF